MTMEVEIISTETIKPSSPTPSHLKTYKLSLFDQMMPLFSPKHVYFYLPSSAAAAGDQEAKSLKLKTSLSQTLSLFYPFAGRIYENFSVDCNDDGAIFVEARARRRLAEVLKQPSHEAVRQFVSLDHLFTRTGSSLPLLAIQTSFFECGGVAIGLQFCHKMADASALATFVTAWSAAALGGISAVTPPDLLTGPSLFPPKDFLSKLQLPTTSKEKISIKRFVFAASNITTLKSKCASHINISPTRVESVSALIWKCATQALRSNSPTKNKKPSVLLQVVNLRKRFTPPLPETSTGNILGNFPVEASGDDDIELDRSVGLLRTGLIEFCDGYVRKAETSCAAVLESMNSKVFDRGNVDLFTVTSCCGFPMKQADFGWGKPIWVAGGCFPFHNVVVLMDASDGGGGFEAWVCLKEEDMAVFEKDQELLAYACLNPPVVDF